MKDKILIERNLPNNIKVVLSKIDKNFYKISIFYKNDLKMSSMIKGSEEEAYVNMLNRIKDLAKNMSEKMWNSQFKRNNPSSVNPKHLKAIKRYENFSQKEVYNKGRINIPIENAIVDGKLVLAKIGNIDTLDYWSDKFQTSKKKNLYTHKFKTRAGIYTNPAGNLLIIYPVKMSERGILS